MQEGMLSHDLRLPHKTINIPFMDAVPWADLQDLLTNVTEM